MFSSILDISSFFIGMLINLLLIALICYYFKRKYESLEVAQNEQAKILYTLIQAQTPRKQFDINELMNNNSMHNLDTINVESDDSDYEPLEDLSCDYYNAWICDYCSKEFEVKEKCFQHENKCKNQWPNLALRKIIKKSFVVCSGKTAIQR